MKLDQNVFLDNIYAKFEYWSCWFQKLGHQVKTLEILIYTLEAGLTTRFWWNLIRIFVVAISRPSWNRGHVGLTSRSLGQILIFLVYTLEATFLTGFLWNFVRMFVLTISRPSLNMCHVGSKARLPGQILENYCLHSRDHICDPIFMKHG